MKKFDLLRFFHFKRERTLTNQTLAKVIEGKRVGWLNTIIIIKYIDQPKD